MHCSKKKLVGTVAIKWHKKPVQLQIKLQVINLIQNERKANMVIQPIHRQSYSALKSLKIRHVMWSTNQKTSEQKLLKMQYG